MAKTLVIAEAGVNHNGSMELAYQLIDAAVDSGADIVKFQTFVTDNLVTKEAKQAKYQVENIGSKTSQWHMLKQLELSFEQHLKLQQYCQRQNIEYLSTAFDLQSLNFLVVEMGLTRLKIPSGEITNAPFLLAHAQTGSELIVSTGMASMQEIEHALAVIAFGFISPKQTPTLEKCAEAYNSEQGQQALKAKVILLHCTTEYPAPISQINLNAMSSMAEYFQLPIGYSDHTQGILVPNLAVAKGAQVIEKHFTLSRKLPGPDHKASLEPNELTKMIAEIRQTEAALGDGVKQTAQCELANREVVRKSLVAVKDIAAGEMFTDENIEVKRPGTGLSPMKIWQLIGKSSQKNYRAGQLIQEKVQ